MYNNYHFEYYPQEPTILDSPFLELFLVLFIVEFYAIWYFFHWFIESRSEKTKYKILKFLVIYSPIWFPVLLFFSAIGITSVLDNQISLFIIPLSLFLFVFLYLYYLVAVYPAPIAYNIINILNDAFGSKDMSQTLTFWTLLDKIKQKRLFLLSFLFVLLGFVFSLDAYFFSKILLGQYNALIGDYGFSIPLVIISSVSLLIYTLIEIFNYGEVNIPKIEHKKTVNLQRIIDKLSLTTGVTPPDFQVLAYNNPTVFSIFPNFGKPTIYITVPLLNMADDNELEGVIGHEFAHIFSGRILYFKRIHNLLILLRTLGFFLLFLFLLSISPLLLILWFYLLFYSCLNVLEKAKEKKFLIEAMFKLLNPPSTLINFLSYIIYYTIARQEEFYADLKTIEFTRYPRGIYSVFQKLKNYPNIKARLPKRFSYLYFTAENTIFEEIPIPQPLIGERGAVLERVDIDLKTAADVKTKKIIKCPYCKSLMEMMVVRGFYRNFNAHYCKKCESFWFGDGNLWYVIDLDFNGFDSKETEGKEVKSLEELLCPQCGVNLQLFKDKSFPLDIKIWNCPVCSGDWLFKKDAVKYLAYKRKFIRK